MEKLVLYCKSYRGDFDRAKILCKSIQKYNTNNISFYISIPQQDTELFKQIEGINILLDDDIYQSNKPGWIKQQLVKANFWKLGLAENYVCLDSDAYFIRPFSISDFMFDGEIPYTVIHEQKELFSWTVSKTKILGFDPKDGFINDRKKIMDLFGRNSKIYDFGPSPTIWSSKVWKDLEEKYIKPNNLTFEQLIEYSPSEFSWYGEALLQFKSIPLYPVEPLFKVFHYQQQYLEYKQQNITEEMIAQNYMGIIMQSNYNASTKYDL